MKNFSQLDQTSSFLPAPRVRYNKEYFGYIVGFPDGKISLVSPHAEKVLHSHVTSEELLPYLLENLEVRDGFHLSTPPLVWLELTRKCNLACPHCYIDAGIQRADEIPTSRWLTLLDEMANMGVWAVAFTGGEPTLHPDFAEIVCYARKRDLLVGIATNGMFLTNKMLESIPQKGVIISVSIDDLHVGSSNHGFSAEEGKKAILRAKSHGFLTNIMTNTHRENIGGLEGLMSWAEKNEVSVRSVPFSPIGRGKTHPDLESKIEDVEQAAKFWLRECEWEHKYHQEAGLCVGLIFNYGLSLSYMTRRCSSGRYLCYIAANGLIFPCTMCAAENIFPSGSVKETSFVKVWRDNWEIRKYSWDNFSDTCKNCVLNDPRYYCASRCPAMSYARNGSFFQCGASEFEILSTIHRTTLLEKIGVLSGD